jgi:Sulfatase/Domain of unknown function (DUF5666)
MPQIVLIVVDALRADHVGCYVGEDRGTPSIDRLAREGVLFQNAVSQASWTRPAMASLLTGLYPSEHGLIDRWKLVDGKLTAVALEPGVSTLPEVLAAWGFETAAFLGGNANLKPLFGITRGFGHLGWCPTNDGTVLVDDFRGWLGSNRRPSAFAYLHFMDVHNPLPTEIIPDRLDRGIDPELIQQSANELRAHYARSVRRADELVGEVAAAVADAELLDDTVFVVTADHGEELADHGAMLAHGRTLYRELLHVPLIVKFPDGAFAGRHVGEPVELIDVVPTLLDLLGRPPLAVSGKSLLPLLRGEREHDFRPAFSELLRRDTYSQSALTASEHFIRSYLFEQVPDTSASDLEVGVSVEAKGQLIRSGPFLATKLSLKQAGLWKVRAPVEAVDVNTGTVTAMSLAFHVDENTQLVGFDKEPFALPELAPGDKVSISFRPEGGHRVATSVKRRKAGGKSKVAGVIEGVQDLEGGLRAITLLGIPVAVSEQTVVSPFRRRSGKARQMKSNALARVVSGDFVALERELFDLERDPAEERNVLDERPDAAQSLETALAAFTDRLAGRARGGPEADVEVDPETLEQLRLMGYVD